MRSLQRQTLVLVFLVVAVVAAISWWGAGAGVRASDAASARSRTANVLLRTQMQEGLALRQFLLTGEGMSLGEASRYRGEFDAAGATARELVAGFPEVERGLEQLLLAQGRWRTAAQQLATQRRRRPAAALPVAEILRVDRQLQDSVEAEESFRLALQQVRSSELTEASRRATLWMVVACLLLAAGCYWHVRRRLKRRLEADQLELRYAERQHHLNEAMAIVDDEAEAHDVLKRHLELAAPGTRATVLSRNNSDNRLEALTPLAGDELLTGALVDASPRDCMAIRRAQVHSQGAGGDEELLRCTICGVSPGATTCQPLLVGGKVIGSVLQESDKELPEIESRRLRDTIEVAAPVLAHVRTLAIAETRASTDALTGLANRRAVADNLKRMVAQASRAQSPLAVIALDLDHFKQVNDVHGHDVGDEVLAAVGTCLRDAVRASDLVGRTGGEELIVIAPDTDTRGAAELAEKLRQAIAALAVTGLPTHISASFGVAALPDHAVSADSLLRRADRALYTAKRNGRDRVEVAGEVITAPPADAGALTPGAAAQDALPAPA